MNFTLFKTWFAGFAAGVTSSTLSPDQYKALESEFKKLSASPAAPAGQLPPDIGAMIRDRVNRDIEKEEKDNITRRKIIGDPPPFFDKKYSLGNGDYLIKAPGFMKQSMQGMDTEVPPNGDGTFTLSDGMVFDPSSQGLPPGGMMFEVKSPEDLEELIRSLIPAQKPPKGDLH